MTRVEELCILVVQCVGEGSMGQVTGLGGMEISDSIEYMPSMYPGFTVSSIFCAGVM